MQTHVNIVTLLHKHMAGINYNSITLLTQTLILKYPTKLEPRDGSTKLYCKFCLCLPSVKLLGIKMRFVTKKLVNDIIKTFHTHI